MGLVGTVPVGQMALRELSQTALVARASQGQTARLDAAQTDSVARAVTSTEITHHQTAFGRFSFVSSLAPASICPPWLASVGFFLFKHYAHNNHARNRKEDQAPDVGTCATHFDQLGCAGLYELVGLECRACSLNLFCGVAFRSPRAFARLLETL